MQKKSLFLGVVTVGALLCLYARQATIERERIERAERARIEAEAEQHKKNLLAEQKRREEEAKQEEERRTREAEVRKAELLRGRLNAGVFKNALAKVPGASNLVADADVNPVVPRQIKILVTTRWLYQPKAVRQELATSLWNLWARIENPDHPDSARISLITPSGTEVGGSRILGGSLIWVDD